MSTPLNLTQAGTSSHVGFSQHSHTYQSSSLTHLYGSEMNNLGGGLGRLVKMALLDPLARAWKDFRKPKISAADLTKQRQLKAYHNGLQAFIKQLDQACIKIGRNPKDPSTLNRIIDLATKHPQFVEQQEEPEKKECQQQSFKPIIERVLSLKPHIQEKLRDLLPVVFQNIKAQEKETSKEELKRKRVIEKIEDRGGHAPAKEHDIFLKDPLVKINKRSAQQTCTSSFSSYDTKNLAPTEGAMFKGTDQTAPLGPLSPIGDINGDRIPDFATSAPRASPGGLQWAGKVWVFYGGNLTAIDPANFTPAQGLTIDGVEAYDGLGTVIVRLGDVNDDGEDDFGIGVPGLGLGTQQGKFYVFFGPLDTPINLAAPNNTKWIVIPGLKLRDNFGTCGSGGIDINGDKIPDFLVAAPSSDVGSLTKAGQLFGIFGHKNPWSSPLNLTAYLDGIRGFVADGIASNGQFGCAMAMGHLNEDEVGDFAAAAPYAGASGRSSSGITFVFYGINGTWPAQQNLTAIGEERGGFSAIGASYDYSGASLAIGGDFKNSGKSSLLIGAPLAINGGKLYVYYQAPNGTTVPIDLTALNSAEGVLLRRLTSAGPFAVSMAILDINNDGLLDLIFGNPPASPDGINAAGEVLGIFGQPDGWISPLDISVNSSGAFTLKGRVPFGLFGSTVVNLGDQNEDGLPDLGVSSPLSSGNNGTITVIFAKNETLCPLPPPPSPIPPVSSSSSSTSSPGTQAPLPSTVDPVPISTPNPTSAPISQPISTSNSGPLPTSTPATPAASSSSTSPPPTPIDITTLAIALGISVPALVAMIVTIVTMRIRRMACFAERTAPTRDDGIFDDL